MYGQITKFRDDIGVGVIEAEDGRKYRFAKAEVVNTADRLIGQGVDFLVVASRPRQIIMMSGSPWTAFGGFVARAANDRE
jgi:cold shock CspA family protein